MQRNSRRKTHLPLIVWPLLALAAMLSHPASSEAGFTIDLPYQQVVPDFLEAITDATADVKDEAELQDIAEWESAARARLPEFLEDLIEIARQLEEEWDPEFTFEQYQAFADKWSVLSQTYPGLNELEPVLGPIFDELLNGLPELQSTETLNPIGDLIDLHNEMLEVKPWFVYIIWDIPVIENAHKVATVTETSHERTVAGFKSIDIVLRDIIVQQNNRTVFRESIENGDVLNRLVAERDPSVLHETLQAMIDNDGARREIEIVQEWVDLVNVHLLTALNQGVLDDCSYSFMYRNQLAGSKKSCTDLNGNTQDFTAISKFSPFDFVNQVELTRLPNEAHVADDFVPAAPLRFINPEVRSFIGSNQAITQPLASAQTANAVAPPLPGAPTEIIPAPEAPMLPENIPPEALLLGILTPAYLWSSAGFLRLF